jgi:integrase
MAVVREYLTVRRSAGLPTHSDAPLFCHSGGGYSRVRLGQLLRRVIRLAGINTMPGRGGPRIHDLRHTFVVHRMTQWYDQGINPQYRLQHLATYLGHRDIHSTLVYLTITRELLQKANQRFRAAEADVLKVIRGEV